MLFSSSHRPSPVATGPPAAEKKPVGSAGPEAFTTIQSVEPAGSPRTSPVSAKPDRTVVFADGSVKVTVARPGAGFVGLAIGSVVGAPVEGSALAVTTALDVDGPLRSTGCGACPVQPVSTAATTMVMGPIRR